MARFRADPSIVRVSVRQLYNDRYWNWTACVMLRDRSQNGCRAYSTSPVEAVQMALTRAAQIKMPGIDIYMEWSYDHPHRNTK